MLEVFREPQAVKSGNGLTEEWTCEGKLKANAVGAPGTSPVIKEAYMNVYGVSALKSEVGWHRRIIMVLSQHLWG